MTARLKMLLGLLGAAAALFAFSRTKQGESFIEAIVANLSQSGLNFIARHEGLVLNAYKDEGGRWTIGYGHLIVPGDPYHPHGPIYEISKEEADALLASDTEKAQQAVRDLVTADITQNMFDALTSLVYNIGRGAFAGSTLLRKLNDGDTAGAQAEFVKWSNVRSPGGELVKSTGLLARRNDEASLFVA